MVNRIPFSVGLFISTRFTEVEMRINLKIMKKSDLMSETMSSSAL